MPYPYMATLPIWITKCENAVVTDLSVLENDNYHNLIIQVTAGSCDVQYSGESHELRTRSVLFLGRNTSAVLKVSEQNVCRYILFVFTEIRQAAKSPTLDLNKLCLAAPLVDSFFSQKTRFCILEDREYINSTMGQLLYEWGHDLGEKNIMLRATMEDLFVKLARSFHQKVRNYSVHYLTQAKNYINDHFQEELTVEAVASEVGISRSYMEALFGKYARMGMVDYIQAVRCDHAAQLLSSTRFAVMDIAMESGFNSRQHFARVFGKVYGMTPSAFRKRNTVKAKREKG